MGVFDTNPVTGKRGTLTAVKYNPVNVEFNNPFEMTKGFGDTQDKIEEQKRYEASEFDKYNAHLQKVYETTPHQQGLAADFVKQQQQRLADAWTKSGGRLEGFRKQNPMLISDITREMINNPQAEQWRYNKGKYEDWQKQSPDIVLRDKQNEIVFDPKSGSPFNIQTALNYASNPSTPRDLDNIYNYSYIPGTRTDAQSMLQKLMSHVGHTTTAGESDPTIQGIANNLGIDLPALVTRSRKESSNTGQLNAIYNTVKDSPQLLRMYENSAAQQLTGDPTFAKLNEQEKRDKIKTTAKELMDSDANQIKTSLGVSEKAYGSNWQQLNLPKDGSGSGSKNTYVNDYLSNSFGQGAYQPQVGIVTKPVESKTLSSELVGKNPDNAIKIFAKHSKNDKFKDVLRDINSTKELSDRISSAIYHNDSDLLSVIKNQFQDKQLNDIINNGMRIKPLHPHLVMSDSEKRDIIANRIKSEIDKILLNPDRSKLYAQIPYVGTTLDFDQISYINKEIATPSGRDKILNILGNNITDESGSPIRVSPDPTLKSKISFGEPEVAGVMPYTDKDGNFEINGKKVSPEELKKTVGDLSNLPALQKAGVKVVSFVKAKIFINDDKEINNWFSDDVITIGGKSAKADQFNLDPNYKITGVDETKSDTNLWKYVIIQDNPNNQQNQIGYLQRVLRNMHQATATPVTPVTDSPVNIGRK